MSHHVADGVIVGAGTEGLSAAYHLTRRTMVGYLSDAGWGCEGVMHTAAGG